MAKLKHAASGQLRVVPSPTLIGRGPGCFLRLDAAVVSSEHALLSWDGLAWRLRDLGSTNGTFVNGVSLDSANSVSLRHDDGLGFGTPESTWTLHDVDPPSLLALDPRDGTTIEPQGGLLSLPSADDPRAVAWVNAAGQAILEVDGETLPLEAPRALALDRVWMVYPHGLREATPSVASDYTLEEVTFEFRVSADQDNCELSVRRGAQRLVMPPREHYYALYVLARARLADAHRPIADRGWMSRDELARALRRSTAVINVAIHRARRQLDEAGLLGAADVVETRAGARRFGSDRVVFVE